MALLHYRLDCRSLSEGEFNSLHERLEHTFMYPDFLPDRQIEFYVEDFEDLSAYQIPEQCPLSLLHN